MPPKSSSGKVVDNALNISEAVLKTLTEVANLTPVPFLKQAASSALTIVDAVKKARNNKAAFEKLANGTCQLVCEVIRIWPEDGATPQKLQADLEALLETLIEIKEYTTKQAEKRTIVRFCSCLLTSNSDADKIAEYTKAIDDAFRLFGFRSNVAMRLKDEQQGDLASNIVTNTNYGNTTTTTIDNLNNDYSVWAYGAPKNRREPTTVTQLPFAPPVCVAPVIIDPIGSAFTGKGARMGYLGANITTNTNSGNTTTTTITNSGHRSFHGPPPTPRGPNFYGGIVAFR